MPEEGGGGGGALLIWPKRVGSVGYTISLFGVSSRVSIWTRSREQGVNVGGAWSLCTVQTTF